MQDSLEDLLKKAVSTDVDASAKTLDKYSHDASIFEIIPKAVVFPKMVSSVPRKYLIIRFYFLSF